MCRLAEALSMVQLRATICRYLLTHRPVVVWLYAYRMRNMQPLGVTRPAGASIAIDDCYELWESGFISIPFDFQVRMRQAPQAGTRLLPAALASM